MQRERDPYPFKCTKCNKVFPSGYALSGHQNAHYRTGVPPFLPPPPPSAQTHNYRLPTVGIYEVNQLPMTLSIGSSRATGYSSNRVLPREENLWRQHKMSRYHPYWMAADKGKETLLHIETIADNFKEIVTLDLLRERRPVGGLEQNGYHWATCYSSSSLNPGEKLDLELKVGF